jgi:hypothetical protein
MAVVLEVRCSAHILTTNGGNGRLRLVVCGCCALRSLAAGSLAETGVEGTACVAGIACRRRYVW